MTVDPAQALARGVTPDALRQSVLKQAAERDVAQDIVAEARSNPKPNPNPSLTAPWSKRPKAYGGPNEHTFDFSSTLGDLIKRESDRTTPARP